MTHAKNKVEWCLNRAKKELQEGKKHRGLYTRQYRDGLSGVYGRFDQKIFEKHKKAILTLQNK